MERNEARHREEKLKIFSLLSFLRIFSDFLHIPVAEKVYPCTRRQTSSERAEEFLARLKRMNVDLDEQSFLTQVSLAHRRKLPFE